MATFNEKINDNEVQRETTPSVASTTMEETGGQKSPATVQQALQPRSVTSKDLRRRKRRFRTSSSPPPTGNVQTLMEMGFPRKAVEEAVKALGGIGNLNPSPESIVGWLLEHQDQVDLGMISHKMSLITIFGHKYQNQKFHQHFYIFHEKYL